MSEFDVSPYMIKFKGQDYLLVAGRVAWLRSDHRDARIETEPVQITERIAVVRAKVTTPEGAVGSGIGSETPSDFGDYIEKAETKAIGRALAALGYGTNAVDFDEGRDADGEVNIVDSPRPMPRAGRDVPVHSAPVPREIVQQANGMVIEGAAPKGLTLPQLIGALNGGGWSFPQTARLKEIVQELQEQFGDEIPGTNRKVVNGRTYEDHWPSDVWNYIARKTDVAANG